MFVYHEGDPTRSPQQVVLNFPSIASPLFACQDGYASHQVQTSSARDAQDFVTVL